MKASEVSGTLNSESFSAQGKEEVVTGKLDQKEEGTSEKSIKIVLDDRMFAKITGNNSAKNETSSESAAEDNAGKNNIVPQNISLTPSYSKKAVVLTYHHISKNPFSGITISPERFEEDLKMLKENNFNVISLREMIDAMEGRSELPQNAVVITFDDGIESFYKYAYPLLKEYNMPAVQFIITARNESYTPSDKELNPLSPLEISEMFQSGLIDIQSHTHSSHDYAYINAELKKGPMLTYRIYYPETNIKESDDEYMARITEDMQTSRETIFKYTGVYPDMLCFPFGSYNKRVISAARTAGFNYFITTEPGYNRVDSKKSIIYRIRSGDAELNSDKLLKSIIKCTTGE